jgi:SAM-dependent methyltransferase
VEQCERENVDLSGRVTRGAGLLEGFLARQRVRVANRRIPAGYREGRILDIGCGVFPYFLATTAFREKYGVDKFTLGEPGVAGSIQLVRHDVEATGGLPFSDGFFDVVTMLAVFEHIEPARLVGTIGEVQRILRPGGMYLLTTPASWTDGFLRLLAWAGLVSREEIEEHKDVYNHAKIVGILRAAGFDGDRIETGYFEGFANLWVTARK